MRCFLLAVALCTAATAICQVGGKRAYPQARTLSGLAGGGSGVAPSGRPSINGALALSTPIGYTLGKDSAILSGSATSVDGQFRWFDGETTVNRSNGTAVAMFGTQLGGLNMAFSLVQTSRLNDDRILNFQFSPARTGNMAFAVGVQDALDQTETTPNYGVSARSLFVAATYDAGGTYLSGGVGTQRFNKGFASLSAPLARGMRGMVEHDGFGWNYGVEVQVFDVETSRASMFVGQCQGQYATWALSWQF